MLFACMLELQMHVLICTFWYYHSSLISMSCFIYNIILISSFFLISRTPSSPPPFGCVSLVILVCWTFFIHDTHMCHIDCILVVLMSILSCTFWWSHFCFTCILRHSPYLVFIACLPSSPLPDCVHASATNVYPYMRMLVISLMFQLHSKSWSWLHHHTISAVNVLAIIVIAWPFKDFSECTSTVAMKVLTFVTVHLTAYEM